MRGARSSCERVISPTRAQRVSVTPTYRRGRSVRSSRLVFSLHLVFSLDLGFMTGYRRSNAPGSASVPPLVGPSALPVVAVEAATPHGASMHLVKNTHRWRRLAGHLDPSDNTA
ncbi:hypothetical protein C8R47DRAFT_1205803 [Mycena vitilis]|nr:hypothetical protein C8R47DRAFT_1205803 [Mycena vitilis]